MGPTKELGLDDIQTLREYVAEGGYVVLMSEAGGNAK